MPDARAEVAKSFEEISAAYRKMFPSRLDPNEPSLFQYAWMDFDAKRIVSLISSDDPSYKLHKDLLFSALCTWVVCPHLNGLRRHGMVLVAIEAMCRNEALGRAAFPDEHLLGDLLGRLSPDYWDFYQDFYYPIGGLKALIRSTSPNTFRKSIERKSAGLPNLIGLMSVLHFHSDHLREKGPYLKASLNRATPTTAKVYGSGKGSGWAADNIDDRWQKLKKTAAMAYAASSISVAPASNLLDTIRSGEASYADHGQHVTEWLRRAKYVAAHILSPMTKPDAARAAESYLPDVEALPFAARHFNSDQVDTIRNGFKAHNPS